MALMMLWSYQEYQTVEVVRGPFGVENLVLIRKHAHHRVLLLRNGASDLRD